MLAVATASKLEEQTSDMKCIVYRRIDAPSFCETLLQVQTIFVVCSSIRIPRYSRLGLKMLQTEQVRKSTGRHVDPKDSVKDSQQRDLLKREGVY